MSCQGVQALDIGRAVYIPHRLQHTGAVAPKSLPARAQRMRSTSRAGSGCTCPGLAPDPDQLAAPGHPVIIIITLLTCAVGGLGSRHQLNLQRLCASVPQVRPGPPHQPPAGREPRPDPPHHLHNILYMLHSFAPRIGGRAQMGGALSAEAHGRPAQRVEGTQPASATITALPATADPITRAHSSLAYSAIYTLQVPIAPHCCARGVYRCLSRSGASPLSRIAARDTTAVAAGLRQGLWGRAQVNGEESCTERKCWAACCMHARHTHTHTDPCPRQLPVTANATAAHAMEARAARPPYLHGERKVTCGGPSSGSTRSAPLHC